MSNHFKSLINAYVQVFPEDREQLAMVFEQLLSESDEKLVDRKNLIGHFTASAFVISKDTHRLLMIHHKALCRYLQPGGHINPENENPLATAQRELLEETGIQQDKLRYFYVDSFNKLVPCNVSVHRIPENRAKKESAHYHYDLQYLFLADEELPLTPQESEVNAARWVNWETFSGMNDAFNRMAKRVASVLKSSPERFLTENIIEFKQGECQCVAVQHIIPSAVPMIKVLHKMFGKNLLVCAKRNSINSEVWEYLSTLGIHLTVASRSPEDPITYYGIRGRSLLIDIGGYFSQLATIPSLPIAGIIEDTENGQRKYEQEICNLKYPVFSVARNILKDNEDELVGEDIVFGADFILRRLNLLLRYMNVACIGYGKIGKGICNQLSKLGVKPKIIECNSIRCIEAIRNGCEFLETSNLSNIDILFCATGSQCLNVIDLRSIKSGAYLILATSSDDELDFHYILQEYSSTTINEDILMYSNKYNYFYILNNGVPTNFVTDSALGNYILLVNAAILKIAARISNADNKFPLGKILSLDMEDNHFVASNWLTEFFSSPFSIQ